MRFLELHAAVTEGPYDFKGKPSVAIRIIIFPVPVEPACKPMPDISVSNNMKIGLDLQLIEQDDIVNGFINLFVIIIRMKKYPVS
jgi:hypothetical protein